MEFISATLHSMDGVCSPIRHEAGGMNCIDPVEARYFDLDVISWQIHTISQHGFLFFELEGVGHTAACQIHPEPRQGELVTPSVHRHDAIMTITSLAPLSFHPSTSPLPTSLLRLDQLASSRRRSSGSSRLQGCV